MQMCGDCGYVYDESEYAGCPRCRRNSRETEHVIVYDKKLGKARSVPKSEAYKYNH